MSVSLTGCVSVVERDVREQLPSSRQTSTTAAARPNSPTYAPSISLPSYFSRVGIEHGDTEVWSTGASITKIESHWARVQRDLQQILPIGKSCGDATWSSSGASNLDWQWKLPNGKAFSVALFRHYTDIYLKFTSIRASNSQNRCD